MVSALAVVGLATLLLQPVQSRPPISDTSVREVLLHYARDDCRAATLATKPYLDGLAAQMGRGPHWVEEQLGVVHMKCLGPEYEAVQNTDDLYLTGRITQRQLAACEKWMTAKNPAVGIFVETLYSCAELASRGYPPR